MARDHFSGYTKGTIPCTLMGLVVALAEWFASSAPEQDYSIDFNLIPLGFMVAHREVDRSTVLQFTISICMCMCLVLTPSAVLQPPGSHSAYFPEGGTLGPSGSLLLCLVGESNAQRFPANSTRA